MYPPLQSIEGKVSINCARSSKAKIWDTKDAEEINNYKQLQFDMGK